MKILAVDPGKRVGYAEVEFGGKVLQNGAVSYNDLSDFLEGLNWDGLVTVVYEAFRVYASHAQHFTGSTMEVSQAVGTITAHAKIHRVPTMVQQPYHYKLGAKYLGLKLPKGHVKDEVSALCHAVSYLKSIDQFTTLLETQLKS